MEWGIQYFLTATIYQWIHLLNDKNKDVILKEWKHQIKMRNIKLYGFVIMPNHYHIIISFYPPKKPWETLRDMHKFISKRIIKSLNQKSSSLLKQFEVSKTDRQYQIWQRNSLPVKLYDNVISEQKLAYIHNNPLQQNWQLAKNPENYFYSSASFYLCEDREFSFITHYMD